MTSVFGDPDRVYARGHESPISGRPVRTLRGRRRWSPFARDSRALSVEACVAVDVISAASCLRDASLRCNSLFIEPPGIGIIMRLSLIHI